MKKFKKIKNNKPANLFISQAELDYHGRSSLSPFDIEQMLTEFIEDCYIAKYNQVIVITGKGKVVRPIVLKLLKNNGYIESFKQASPMNGGEGAIEIVLK